MLNSFIPFLINLDLSLFVLFRGDESVREAANDHRSLALEMRRGGVCSVITSIFHRHWGDTRRRLGGAFDFAAFCSVFHAIGI